MSLMVGGDGATPAFTLWSISHDTAELRDQRGIMIGVIYRRRTPEPWELFLYSGEGMRLTSSSYEALRGICDRWGAES